MNQEWSIARLLHESQQLWSQRFPAAEWRGELAYLLVAFQIWIRAKHGLCYF